MERLEGKELIEKLDEEGFEIIRIGTNVWINRPEGRFYPHFMELEEGIVYGFLATNEGMAKARLNMDTDLIGLGWFSDEDWAM